MLEKINLEKIKLTKYLFFTGKGGTGKTSTACSIAVNLADSGKKVFLISTDPASNLQDVFNTSLTNKAKKIIEIPNLWVANLDPIISAEEYRDSLIKPYVGILPDVALENMKEQLSGSCTVEIASFNEFSHIITDKELNEKYDYIIFDTAPTGHTLRMLTLPSAWSSFIDTNKFGSSCLGQLAGLGEEKETYYNAMNMLKNENQTTLFLITRAEETPIKEAARSSYELNQIGIENQVLIVNAIIEKADDEISDAIYLKQQENLKKLPIELQSIKKYMIPLRGYNVVGIDNIRNLINSDEFIESNDKLINDEIKSLKNIIDDIEINQKKVIFTMGKGGVGKTTVASAIALELSNRGKKVVLATTDPADHLKYVISNNVNLEIIKIDEQEELQKYKNEVINKAKENNILGEDLEYIEEDLRSPCTQEIALFKAFAKIVDKADEKVVVIDTAPTGHTLLLLDTTQTYNKEISKTQGEVPEEVIKLLPRLRNEKETEVIIVTLPETTPVFEANRLMEDLKRAKIYTKWWVINSSIYFSGTTNNLLKNRSINEIKCINKVYELTNNSFAIIKWVKDNLKESNLNKIL